MRELREKPAGTVRITASEYAADAILLPKLATLLPKYPGLHTHQRALDAGDALHGASVHFVTAELDGGPVIAQAELTVRPDDTPESLAERLLPREHRLLVACVRAIAHGHVRLCEGRVEADGTALPEPLQLASDGELHRRGID